MRAADPFDDLRDPHVGTLVSARGIALHEQRGHLFGPLDIDIDLGGVTLMVTPASIRRTALLLSLCGRMHLSSGSLTVLGYQDDPRSVFAQSNVCCIREIDDVAQAVTVRDLITEQLRWNAPFFRRVPRVDKRMLVKVCGDAFGDVPLPKLDAFVTYLPDLQQLLLKIAIANLRHPPLLVVGRLDEVTNEHEQSRLLERLVDLGRTQSILVGTSNPPPDDWTGQVVDLSDLAVVPDFAPAHGVRR